MTRNRKLIAGGIAIVALAAGAVAASAHRGGMGAFGGARGHGLMGAICSGNGAEMADHVLVSIEYKVKPTAAQKPAFDELKSAARAAAAKAATACPPAPAKSADGTAPAEPAKKSPVERLAMMEARLTAELDAVRTVRPAAEKFFASLTDDQKKALTEREPGRGGWGYGEGGGGPQGHWHHHYGRAGDRSDEAPGAQPPAADKP